MDNTDSIIRFNDKESMRAYFQSYLKEHGIDESVFIAKLKEAAKSGVPKWQCLYATALGVGVGCKENVAEAIRWWIKAAEQGDDEATFTLGHNYYYGSYTRRNYRKAVYWLEISAKSLNPEAHFLLGTCYHWGLGVTRNYQKAFLWFELASQGFKNGNADLDAEKGYCYYRGHGVQQDYMKAIELFKSSAAGGSTNAMFYLGVCYAYGKGVKKQPSEAIKWWQRAAEQGHPGAEKRLSQLFLVADVLTR